MRNLYRSLCATTVSLVAALVLSACYNSVASLKKPNMIALSPRLQPLFQKTKTVCFGRFVIDVPANATVVFGPSDVPSQIERWPGEATKLAERVAHRENELKSEDRYPTGSGATLYKETLNGMNPAQKIVVGWETFSSSFYKIESFIKLGPDLYIQEDQAFPEKKPQQTDLSSPEESVALLNDIARSLRARADDEVPSDPGVCIDGAFIAGQLDQQFERISFGIRLKEFPDVHLSISAHKAQFIPDESQSVATERLLKEAEHDADQSGHGAWYSSIKFFRRGNRELNGWHGYEVASRKPAQKDVHENHEFLYVSQGAPKNSFKPSLDIQFNTGVKDDTVGAVPPSLTDEEAIAVWDKLIGSIRVRPTNGGVKTSEAPAPKIPLGELAATGRVCPETGWWRCAEQARPVQGGQRQFFHAGEGMPVAVLLDEPTLWQKLKGERPNYTTSTVWELVAYERPPATIAEPPSTSVDAQTPSSSDVASTDTEHASPSPENDGVEPKGEA